MYRTIIDVINSIPDSLHTVGPMLISVHFLTIQYLLNELGSLVASSSTELHQSLKLIFKMSANPPPSSSKRPN